MKGQFKLEFNPNPPTIVHLDLDSCFATIEQQANPLLRRKPIAVAAYTTPSGCILAPSIEAKQRGVKTGMRVKEGKVLCPELIVLEPDPNKYRFVHLGLRKILRDYTNDFVPKSIDEFVLNLEDHLSLGSNLSETIKEIKIRIKKEIGEWLSVSAGIGPNRLLAKVASNLDKPDGLVEINKNNFLEIYRKLKLSDLHGINSGNTVRLNSAGIFTVLDFYNSSLWQLKAAFKSVLSYYWYLRLKGWEIDDVKETRRSFGNSYALPHSEGSVEELLPILQKLVEKTGSRLRQAGYRAGGVSLALSFKDNSFWHKGKKLERSILDSREIFKEIRKLLFLCPQLKPVRVLSESVFGLESQEFLQLELFEDKIKQASLTASVDQVNQCWGEFVVAPAGMILKNQAQSLKGEMKDRISFGGVRELE